MLGKFLLLVDGVFRMCVRQCSRMKHTPQCQHHCATTSHISFVSQHRSTLPIQSISFTNMFYARPKASMKSRKIAKFQVLGTFTHEVDGEPVLMILCQGNNKLCITGTTDLKCDVYNTDLGSWLPQQLNLEMIHPRYERETMTKVNTFTNHEMFIKRPNYIETLRDFNVDLDILDYLNADLMRREVDVCEEFKRNPHRNVATYYGVEASTKLSIKDATVGFFPYELVSGLCFEYYPCTLHDQVMRKQHIDVEKVVSDVQAGIEHIHSLDLVHCDIKPDNIFFKDGRYVVGDFDSVHPVHGELCLKTGTLGWYDTHITHAEFENDLVALHRLRQWLENRPAYLLPEDSTPRHWLLLIVSSMDRLVGLLVGNWERIRVLLVGIWLFGVCVLILRYCVHDWMMWLAAVPPYRTPWVSCSVEDCSDKLEISGRDFCGLSCLVGSAWI
jgi:hypothetical protein